MLTLDRLVNQGFHIGNDIHIVVLRAGKKVRLGIAAPNNVEITRDEVFVEMAKKQGKKITRERKEGNY